MISNSRRRSTKIPPEGFAQWALSANKNLGSRDAVNKNKLQQINVHYKQRFLSISGSTKITQDVSDSENEAQKRKGTQVIEKADVDTIDMTQTQNNKKKIIRKRRTRSSRHMEN